jgi:hypothetical protein
MSLKKDLLSREEIERGLRYNSVTSKNRSAQEALLKLLGEMQISLDEPKVEDSIDGRRIHVTYTLDIRRIRRGRTDQDAIRFQYLKEIPTDYYNVPTRLEMTIRLLPALTQETMRIWLIARKRSFLIRVRKSHLKLQ